MKPVYISGEVSLANGEIKAITNSSLGLANPNAAPMWIDQIGITVSNIVAFSRNYPRNAIIHADINLAGQDLTSGFVPCSFLAEPPDHRGALRDAASSYLTPWVLSRPIFVPEKEFIFPRFYHSGRGITSATQVRFTMVGRSLEARDPLPDPATLSLPYVSSWIPTARAGGSNYTAKSSESDLRNPFSTPLDVVAVIGQMVKASGGSIVNIVDDASVFEGTLVRIVNQDGSVVVKDSSEFFTLFGVDNFWRANFQLPNSGYLVMNLIQNYSALSAANTYRPQFGMVGYRQAGVR